MTKTFIELGVPEEAADALKARGITEAFPIQELTVPAALDGKDVCGRAPTGSGKTIAFGIPLAHRVRRAKPKRPKALVLAPTRELAEQIQEEFRLLLAPYGRSVASFYGGVGIKPQINKLRRGVDVAVCCPGRLGDLMRNDNIRLDDVDIVVIDEADRMADMGFLPDVKRILDQVKPDRQTLLFSATLDGDVDVLIKRYQNNPEKFEVDGDDGDEDLTTHHFVDVSRSERVPATAQLINDHGTTVVFCRTKHGTDRVARQLKNEGISAVPIHGGRSQGQRKRALAAFTNGQAQALVATDVAARGIHVDNVSCVVHFDPAGDHKDYIHRSGRTGRAGAEGTVISLVTAEDRSKVNKMQRQLGMATTGGNSNGNGGGGSNSGGGSGKSGSKSRGGSNGKSRNRNGSGRGNSGGGNRSRGGKSGGSNSQGNRSQGNGSEGNGSHGNSSRGKSGGGKNSGGHNNGGGKSHQGGSKKKARV